MRTWFFKSLAYGTLVVDAYLALATVAAGVVPYQLHYYVPPFGWLGASDASRWVVLLVATWTALLAIGTLRGADQRPEQHDFAGTLWFLLVLALVWAAMLFSLLVQAVAGR